MCALVTTMMALLLWGLPQASADEPKAKDISANVVKVWEKAGARYGRATIDMWGKVEYQGGLAGESELPAFSPKYGMKISELPAPDVPFGLFLDTEVSPAELKEMHRFTHLRLLSIGRGNRVNKLLLKELTGFKNLQVESLASLPGKNLL